MVRPATLDRVENGGSGSDINRRERQPQETTLDNRALFRPVIIQSAAALEAVKARPGNGGVRRYGGATAGLDSFCARRRRKSRSGQKKSYGAVEQKKGPKQESKSARKKVLAFVTAIRERRNGLPVEQRNCEQRNLRGLAFAPPPRAL